MRRSSSIAFFASSARRRSCALNSSASATKSMKTAVRGSRRIGDGAFSSAASARSGSVRWTRTASASSRRLSRRRRMSSAAVSSTPV